MGAVGEAYSTDLQTVLQSYKGYAVDNEWIRGITFQLVHALGVGRHAYGLHHNDLSTTSNIKLKQFPLEGRGVKKWVCYELSECTFVIDPPNCRHHTAGLCKDCPVPAKCNAVLDEDGGLAADKLPNDGCAAGQDESGEGPAPEPEQPELRTSWCIDMNTVDGMSVKLSGFLTSSLSKKALEYWKKGYTFMNTAWNDDMEDVAVILCGLAQPKIAHFDPRAEDLCLRMRAGEYRNSPLAALRHPYFAPLRSKDKVSPPKRNMYRYTPGCPVPKPSKEKVPTAVGRRLQLPPRQRMLGSPRSKRASITWTAAWRRSKSASPNSWRRSD